MPANPLNIDDFGGELYNLGMSEGGPAAPRPGEGVHRRRGRADHRGVLPRSARAGTTAGASRPASSSCSTGVKAKAKANGLWNFFLPDAETGQGLSNLDYAYIAVELGKNPLASECLNCSAPDTGNMEVLERVGTPEQKKQWLEPLLNGEIRSALRA